MRQEVSIEILNLRPDDNKRPYQFTWRQSSDRAKQLCKRFIDMTNAYNSNLIKLAKKRKQKVYQ